MIGYVGFLVLTAVVGKSSVFWNITPCSLWKVNRCFGGKHGVISSVTGWTANGMD
jgi:hypothetical protein